MGCYTMYSREEQFGEKFEGEITDTIYSNKKKDVYVYSLKIKRGSRTELYALKEKRLIYRRGKFDVFQRKEKAYKDYEEEKDDKMKKAEEEADIMYEFLNASHIINYMKSDPCEWKEENEFGYSYLIMTPLMTTLDQLIKDNKVFDESEIIKIGIHIAEALNQFHECDYFHQDVKPQNIFFDQKNQGNYILGDLDSTRSIKISDYTLSHTPGFDAPEQAKAASGNVIDCDFRADIYCLGLVLYILFNNNQHPFTSTYNINSDDYKKRINHIGLLPRPKGVNEQNEFSKELANIILRACASDPNDRYQSVKDFINALITLDQRMKPSKFRDKEHIETPAVIGPGVTEPARPGIKPKGTPIEEPENELDLTTVILLSDDKFSVKDGILTEYEGSGGIITIPDTVTNINYAVFRNRVDIKEVRLSKSLSRIGGHAFSGCTKLSNIDIPDGVVSIGAYAFSDNRELKKVSIPSSVIAIEAGAFSNCSSLSSVIISDGVKKIGSSAFKGCTNLGQLNLPDSIIAIGSDAFTDCPNLTICVSGDSFAKNFAEENHINYIESVEWLIKSAKQGNAHSQWQLSIRYKEGKDIPQNKKEALKWLTKSAEQGLKFAQWDLGLYYQGIKEAFDAIKWFKKAAEQDYAYAQYAVAKYYEYGFAVTQDKRAAVEWYTKAANQGLAEAQFALGLKYENGFDYAIHKDMAKAIYWYTEAANQGLLTAQCSLADCYMKGKGGIQDSTKAVEWYTKAAEQNDVDAQFKLSCCYKDGIGVSKDLKKATEWYNKVLESVKDKDKQYDIGCTYLYGMGVSKDETWAVEWFIRAAEQDHVDAQYKLAKCYMNGKGVPKDEDSAVYWLKKAADQDNYFAQYDLAKCYIDGKGVLKDETEAVKLLKKSANHYSMAQYELGKCYLNGKGISQDIDKAIELLIKVAEQGDEYVPELEYYYEDMLKKFITNKHIINNTENGIVEKINFKIGQQVKTGDVMFVLNTSDSNAIEVRSPISGTVKFVAAYKNRKVSSGAFLAALSPRPYYAQLPKSKVLTSNMPNLLVENSLLVKYNGIEKDIIVPDEIIEIAPRAFYNCNQLISILISNGVNKIGKEAFYGCANLTSIIIPKSVNVIDDDVFKNCSNQLTAYIITDTYSHSKWYVENSGISFAVVTENGVLTEYHSAKLGSSNHSKTVILPEIVKIGKNAFSNSRDIEKVIISEGVQEIEKEAFWSCKFLTRIDIPASVRSIGQGVFSGCNALTIHAPAKSYAEEYARKHSILFSEST